MAEIYLFRHSHVDYRPPQGITAHNPLTPLGHQMAQRLAERCDAWDLQCLFASTMRRARETADAIAARFPALSQVAMPELAEASIDDLSDYRGALPPEDMRSWDSEHYAHAYARLYARVTMGFERVLHEIAARGLERVAIVSHGGPMNMILRYYLGSGAPGFTQTWFFLDWAATCCLRLSEGRRWVRWVNDARHIDDLRHLLPEEG